MREAASASGEAHVVVVLRMAARIAREPLDEVGEIGSSISCAVRLHAGPLGPAIIYASKLVGGFARIILPRDAAGVT